MRVCGISAAYDPLGTETNEPGAPKGEPGSVVSICYSAATTTVAVATILWPREILTV